jgi:hypothetical protein
MIWIIGLLTIITVILGFIAVMVWAIGDKIIPKIKEVEMYIRFGV